MRRAWAWLVRVSGSAALAVIALAATWTHIVTEVLLWVHLYHTGRVELTNFWLSLWTLIVDMVILLGQRAQAQRADQLLEAQQVTMDALAAHMRAVEELLRDRDGGR